MYRLKVHLIYKKIIETIFWRSTWTYMRTASLGSDTISDSLPEPRTPSLGCDTISDGLPEPRTASLGCDTIWQSTWT